MTDKKVLRTSMAAARAKAHATADPAPALHHLSGLLDGALHPVSFYWPIRTELDPRPVMGEWQRKGAVCLPVTAGYAPLTFRAWTPEAEMETDGFGVSIPKNGPEMLPRTLVIPLLAFDKKGQRLGYGAGHYDRTLEKLRALHPVTAIGLAYSAQECEQVPTEPTDQPLDMIVTELGILAPLS